MPEVIQPLLVFAHRDEASAFTDVPHLITGVGKVQAAGALAEALAGRIGESGSAPRVIVLGTAGVVSDGPERPSLDEVYQITEAVQHDFSLPSPALRPAGDTLVGPEATAVIATGDVFVKDDAQRAHIAGLGATLVDMETYAYAAICERFGAPLQVFKIPSDFADSSTTDEEWDVIVFRKSEQLRAFYDRVLS